MSTRRCCPDQIALHALLEGNTAGADLKQVEEHVRGCRACQALLREMPTTDNRTLWVLGRPTGMASTGAFPFLLPAAAADELGRLGSYRVLRLLGKGGMGYVFHAEDMTLRRAVALKVMKPDIEQEVNSQRFLREARLMASIKHEALVTVYQVGQENGAIYLAMELLEGETLAEWQARVRRPDLAAILQIARGVASGLAAIHERGLIHRDLKPGNLWIEPGGNVKILDFGLARLVDDTPLTQIGTILGTPSFMSPEQARGQPVDQRSDLFSFGAILYCLCTGRSPFHAPNVTAILTALALNTPRPITHRNPALPPALSELVSQLLAKAPEHRPASAQDVLARLEQIEAKPPVQAAGVSATGPQARRSVPDRTSTRARRRPPRMRKRLANGRRWLRIGLAILLLGLAIVVPWVALARHRSPVKGKTPPGERPAELVYLSDLEPSAKENWPLLPPVPPGHQPMQPTGAMHVQGKEIGHGIFMHPPPPRQNPTSLTYNLGGAYRTFHATVSLLDGPPRSQSALIFAVHGDERLLWKSRPVWSQADAQQCSISVKDVKQLKLTVTSDGDPRGGHAVWVDPSVSR